MLVQELGGHGPLDANRPDGTGLIELSDSQLDDVAGGWVLSIGSLSIGCMSHACGVSWDGNAVYYYFED